jgi:hypothetical protein
VRKDAGGEPTLSTALSADGVLDAGPSVNIGHDPPVVGGARPLENRAVRQGATGAAPLGQSQRGKERVSPRRLTPFAGIGL